jgi:hypothetical protein
MEMDQLYYNNYFNLSFTLPFKCPLVLELSLVAMSLADAEFNLESRVPKTAFGNASDWLFGNHVSLKGEKNNPAFS